MSEDGHRAPRDSAGLDPEAEYFSAEEAEPFDSHENEIDSVDFSGQREHFEQELTDASSTAEDAWQRQFNYFLAWLKGQRQAIQKSKQGCAHN